MTPEPGDLIVLRGRHKRMPEGRVFTCVHEGYEITAKVFHSTRTKTKARVIKATKLP